MLHDRIDGTAAAIERQTALDTLCRRSVTSDPATDWPNVRRRAGRQRPGAGNAAPASLIEQVRHDDLRTPASAAAAVVPAPP